MPPRHRWAPALLLVVVPASVRAQDPEIVLTPGLAHLELRFGNSNQAIIDYLTANPVRSGSWPPDELPVRLFNPGQGQPTARTDYVPGGVPPAASATAIARPDVSPAGSSFLIEVDHLDLGSSATYRFGTSNAIAPSAHTCGPVSPQEAQPAGTTCPLSECAALLELRVILKDEGPDPAGHPDLAGLDRQAPVYCGAQVYVEEAAYSQVFVPQATSGATFDIDTLSGEGGVLPVLARADGSRLRVNVSCQARVKDGEVGFVLVPGTDRGTPLAPAPVFRTPACDALLRVDLPIEVERTAGVLKGLFDVNGRTETRTEVWFVHDRTWFTLQPPAVPAGSTPGPGPSWIYEGAPSTAGATRHDLGARALVDGGRRSVELPHRRGLNHEVDVPRGGTTDLGSTFVTRPHPLPGTVVLDDRGVGIGLDRIRTAPFQWFYEYLNDPSTSSITAVGRPELAPGGKSGDRGISRSVLEGGYDATTGKSRLGYELLLTGLSDAEDAPDGSGSAPTPWLVQGLSLTFEDPAAGVEQSLGLTIGPLLPRTTKAIPASGRPLPLEPLPELHVCLGKIKFTLKTDPAQALLYAPRAGAYTSPAAPILTIPDDPYSLYEMGSAWAQGTPTQIEGRTDRVEVSLLLPAGAQYWVHPSVYVASLDGSDSTYAGLDSRPFPAVGQLQCGTTGESCLQVGDDGVASELSLAVTPPVPACQETPEVAFQVSFQNDRPVKWLKLQVDGQAEQVLCSPCTQPDGSTPPVSVDLDVPADGQAHVLRLTAEDEIACPAEQTLSVLVPSQPLTLVCPQDFTCAVPQAEIPLSADHSCITGGLTDPQVVGGCQYPTALADDRPTGFPAGATEVTFTASPGGAACSTTVTVARMPGRQLAYAEGDQLKVRELGTGLFQMVRTAPFPVTWIEFDAAGDRLAAAMASAQRAAIVYDVESGAELYHLQTHPEGANLQFSPADRDRIALVARSPSPPVRYWVELFVEQLPIGTYALPPEDYASLPEIAWSTDGARLLALYTAPQIAGGVPTQDPFHARLFDWDVAASGLGNPTRWSMDRPGPREEPFEAIYYGPAGAAEYCSNRGVSKAGGTSLPLISDVPNDHMDLTADTRLAAFVRMGERDTTLAVVESPGSGPPAIRQGPTLPMRRGFKPRVAISDDGSRIAVSLGDRIEVFAYPGFAPVDRFNAEDVQHMRFRPLTH